MIIMFLLTQADYLQTYCTIPGPVMFSPRDSVSELQKRNNTQAYCGTANINFRLREMHASTVLNFYSKQIDQALTFYLGAMNRGMTMLASGSSALVEKIETYASSNLAAKSKTALDFIQYIPAEKREAFILEFLRDNYK